MHGRRGVCGGGKGVGVCYDSCIGRGPMCHPMYCPLLLLETAHNRSRTDTDPLLLLLLLLTVCLPRLPRSLTHSPLRVGDDILEINGVPIVDQNQSEVYILLYIHHLSPLFLCHHYHHHLAYFHVICMCVHVTKVVHI